MPSTRQAVELADAVELAKAVELAGPSTRRCRRTRRGPTKTSRWFAPRQLVRRTLLSVESEQRAGDIWTPPVTPSKNVASKFTFCGPAELVVGSPSQSIDAATVSASTRAIDGVGAAGLNSNYRTLSRPKVSG